jgi:hypothetical protein
MKKSIIFTLQFVEHIREHLQERTLYISMKYATATHLCACGCRNEVVTPFSPTDWQLHFDGDSVSLTPSIGNWQFPCRSHYWIQHSTVVLARQWSKKEIEDDKRHDRHAKEAYYETAKAETIQDDTSSQGRSTWARLKRRFL